MKDGERIVIEGLALDGIAESLCAIANNIGRLVAETKRLADALRGPKEDDTAWNELAVIAGTLGKDEGCIVTDIESIANALSAFARDRFPDDF